MDNDPLNLDTVAFECLGYSLASNTGTAFLEGLIGMKKTYDEIEHPQKSAREVANHSSVVLDLQTSGIILDLTDGNSYIGIKDLSEGTTYPIIKKGISALKKEGMNRRSGAYEYRENMFLVYKKEFAERENLFIRVSDK